MGVLRPSLSEAEKAELYGVRLESMGEWLALQLRLRLRLRDDDAEEELSVVMDGVGEWNRS